MQERWEKECTDLRAELVALQNKLYALETKQGGVTASAHPLSRWRFSKTVMVVVLPVVMLLAAGGVLYGQGAIDALFIDQAGNVGIGTTTPSAKLEVSLENPRGWEGNLRGLRLFAPDRDYALDVNTYVVVSGSVGYQFRPISPGSKEDTGLVITTPGDVGIGTKKPTVKLEVNGRVKDQTGYVMPVGAIVAYRGTTAPQGWLLCDGKTIPNGDEYKELRALAPITPDLRGRTLIGVGQGTELTARPLGELGGEEKHTLTIAEMPKHNHHGFGESYDPYWPFGRVGPKGQKGSNGGVDQDNFYYNTSETGDSRPFNNMQPYYVVNYIIKY